MRMLCVVITNSVSACLAKIKDYFSKTRRLVVIVCGGVGISIKALYDSLSEI